MSLGQTMVTAAFFVLVMVMTISANRLLLDSTQTYVESESLGIGIDFAQGLLLEASRKKFDGLIKTDYYQPVTEFTSPYALGPSGSETISVLPESAPFASLTKFDDADDYNGYSRMVSSDVVKDFRLTVSVYYVNPSTPDVKATSQTYFKRIDVSVEQASYLKKVTLSIIITY